MAVAETGFNKGAEVVVDEATGFWKSHFQQIGSASIVGCHDVLPVFDSTHIDVLIKGNTWGVVSPRVGFA